MKTKKCYETHKKCNGPECNEILAKAALRLGKGNRLVVVQKAKGLSDMFVTQTDGTLSQASEGYRAWLEDNNLGASALLPTSGDVYRNGQLYARISYDGRVWALDGTPHPDSDAVFRIGDFADDEDEALADALNKETLRTRIAMILVKYADNMIDPNEGADIAVCEKVADEILKAVRS
jgi:hypothetical protein